MRHIVAKMWMVPAVRHSRCLKLLPMPPKAAKAQCEGTQDCCGQACDSAACKAACGGKCDPANCDKADCKKQNAQSKIVKTKNKEGADYE